jgi:hypothetical protein
MNRAPAARTRPASMRLRSMELKLHRHALRSVSVMSRPYGWPSGSLPSHGSGRTFPKGIVRALFEIDLVDPNRIRPMRQ